MHYSTYIILFFASIPAGIMNTIGGGGGVITLPIMIFAGIPSNIANATNRAGVIAQNIMAVWQFRRGGVKEDGLAWRLTLAGLPGCWIGARLAAEIKPDRFNLILGILMLLLMVLVIAKPRPRASSEAASRNPWKDLSARRKALLLLSFFLLGTYAGFLQAGIGVIILVVLTYLIRIDMVRANSVKLIFILVQQLFAFSIFLSEGIAINWAAAGVLIAGQSVGASMGSWVALKKGEKWMNAIILASLALASAKLFGLF